MIASTAKQSHQKTRFLPREHGATAMLLTPMGLRRDTRPRVALE